MIHLDQPITTTIMIAMTDHRLPVEAAAQACILLTQLAKTAGPPMDAESLEWLGDRLFDCLEILTTACGVSWTEMMGAVDKIHDEMNGKLEAYN